MSLDRMVVVVVVDYRSCYTVGVVGECYPRSYRIVGREGRIGLTW